MAKLKSFQLNIILLGDPGAGKASQAEYFAKKYKLYDFDMGRELTVLRDNSKKASNELKKNYDKGKLAPTKMVRAIIQEKFDRTPASQGILFDGHPKMLGEAKMVSNLLKKTNRTNPLVLYLGITHDEIIQRVLHRKGYAHTKFTKRLHDTKIGLKNRARYYRTNIKQVKEFLKSHYTFAHIDGMGTRAEVRKRMQKAIDFYIKHYDEIYKKTGRN